ncbi:hypothetical protein F511_35578 [Dorcoceras hygrometricum]|uniref:Uncharacterized protein n=1 Tax=Dorcoceras hygrometricum TaxID=472368 RepID=A0A2Z7AIC5_9LAMI|nr:hypothetical protein F511_35578 [Dorcoceras hygrometricum]
MRCLNGPREQSSNTVALDENNRAKLVKDKPDRPKSDQLGEEKIGSGDLVKMYAYERVETVGRMISLRSLTSSRKPRRYTWRKTHVVKKANQQRRKLAGKQAQSPVMSSCNEQASSMHMLMRELRQLAV